MHPLAQVEIEKEIEKRTAVVTNPSCVSVEYRLLRELTILPVINRSGGGGGG